MSQKPDSQDVEPHNGQSESPQPQIMFQIQPHQRLSLVPRWIVLLVVAAMLQACQFQSVKKEGQATQPSISQLAQLEETVALQQR